MNNKQQQIFDEDGQSKRMSNVVTKWKTNSLILKNCHIHFKKYKPKIVIDTITDWNE